MDQEQAANGVIVIGPDQLLDVFGRRYSLLAGNKQGQLRGLVSRAGG
jgi:hypothetical protein